MAEWQRGDVFTLINLYKERRLLWDPSEEDYKNRIRKHNSWRELDELLGVRIGECEKKMRKLVGQFQRECKRVAAMGKSADEGRWIYFKRLMFLMEKNRPRSKSKAEVTDSFGSFENVTDEATCCSLPPSKVLKQQPMSTELQLIAAAEKLANSSEIKLMDSWEAYGLSVGGDLRTLDSKQQTIAQKLISEVIFLAKLGRLSECSVVTEPPPHFMTSNLAPTPPLSNVSMPLSPYHQETSLK